jgi:hypothetical protein
MNIFVQPKFTGSRFANHTFPVDVARDLAAYEALLIELAKCLYLLEHPERQRVPKGFADKRLDIVSVGEGSAMPALALIASAMLPLQMPLLEHEDTYFSRARDLIAECVAAPETALPKEFPKELLSYFNQFGRSLKKDETLELARSNNFGPAVLTPEKRKKLVLAVNAVYEHDMDMSGYIAEADWVKNSFRLCHTDGSQTTIPMLDDFRDEIRLSGGRSRDYVFVKGVASYDSSERLQKVLSVESLEVIKNYPLAVQFDDLAQLEIGWYDGSGQIPDRNKFKIFSQKLIDLYPEKLPLPTIVPTQDGNLLMEWDALGEPSADIDFDRMLADFHAFGSNGEDMERSFQLNENEDFESFFTFLSEHIHSRSV